MKEGVPLTVVTRKGECFEVVFRGQQANIQNRAGTLYKFALNDLTDRKRGQRLVSVYLFGDEKFYASNFDLRLDSVLLNVIRRAFDSAQLSFEDIHDPNTYTEISIEQKDFMPQDPTNVDGIRQFIKYEAYWLGFRHNDQPGYPIQFDSPVDLEYLGVTTKDVKRYVLLLEQSGLLEKVMEAYGRPTSALINEVELEAPRTTEDDHMKFVRIAIEEAKLSVPEHDGREHPKVGVVIVKDGRVLAKAHRGEFPKEHAEHIALERKLKDSSVVDATLYTTLEPCTTRSHPKVPCALRLVERRVARVFIGMLDPNPDITGKGQIALNDAGIETQFFPHKSMAEVTEQNRNFIRDQRQKAHQRTAVRREESKTEGMGWDVPEITLKAHYIGREPDSQTFACESIRELPGVYVPSSSADGGMMVSTVEFPALLIMGIDAEAVRALPWEPNSLLFNTKSGELREVSGTVCDSLESSTVKFAIRD